MFGPAVREDCSRYQYFGARESTHERCGPCSHRVDPRLKWPYFDSVAISAVGTGTCFELPAPSGAMASYSDGNRPYIQALQDLGECVFLGTPQAVIAADPADDPVLATAVAGEARVLCTLDRHFASEPAVEYARAHGIELMNDVELLRRLRSCGADIQ